MIVAGCMAAGVCSADQQRAETEAGARRLPRGLDGQPIFEAPGIPEGFIRFAAGRIPSHDPVQYVTPGVELCRPGGTPARVWGRVFWVQYRLAPRPTVCGTAARWRVYLNATVPPNVAAGDRWSATLAVVRVGRR
jgi:hypothetical protein